MHVRRSTWVLFGTSVGALLLMPSVAFAGSASGSKACGTLYAGSTTVASGTRTHGFSNATGATFIGSGTFSTSWQPDNPSPGVHSTNWSISSVGALTSASGTCGPA
jgi:hypothetical protein